MGNDRAHYQYKGAGSEIVFVPPSNVTITSIRPVGGKVILNGVEQDSIPVDCKPGDSVIIKCELVTSGTTSELIVVDWFEHPADLVSELRTYIDADDDSEDHGYIRELMVKAADKIEELDDKIVQLMEQLE